MITQNPMQEVLFTGKLFQLINGQHQPIEQARLTAEEFLNIKVVNIIKMKVKAESQINGTRVIKLSTNNQ